MRFLSVLLALTLGACVSFQGVSRRAEVAQAIAVQSNLVAEKIPVTPFQVMSYQRISQVGQPVTVYLEGDGLAWIDRTQPSADPTPTDPVALRLAARDSAANVVYLARPCQYADPQEKQSCTYEYWTTQRFAPKIITSINHALDRIKAKIQATGFHLVGYSGGGAVAVLLAAQRPDVLSVKTLAGNLDTARFTAIHGVTPLKGSLNPADVAAQISSIPQLHFIGADDTVIPKEIFESFQQASGQSHCIKSVIVKADHHHNWAEQWPTLLQMKPACE